MGQYPVAFSTFEATMVFSIKTNLFEYSEGVGEETHPPLARLCCIPTSLFQLSSLEYNQPEDGSQPKTLPVYTLHRCCFTH